MNKRSVWAFMAIIGGLAANSVFAGDTMGTTQAHRAALDGRINPVCGNVGRTGTLQMNRNSREQMENAECNASSGIPLVECLRNRQKSK